MPHYTLDTSPALTVHIRHVARLFLLALIAFVALPSAVWAGEIKFGQGHDSLDVDDGNALTADGKKAVVKEIDKTPGEDQWETQLWAKVDKGAEGPIYVEFYQTVDGKEYIVQRYDEDDYDGGKYFVMNLVLDGNVGFNKDRTYRVVIIQVDMKGKDLKLAKGSVKLIDTGRKPEPEEEDDEDDTEDDVDQDDIDGLDDTPTKPEPPPVAPPAKGCAVVAADKTSVWSAAVGLVLLGLRRRWRDGLGV